MKVSFTVEVDIENPKDLRSEIESGELIENAICDELGKLFYAHKMGLWNITVSPNSFKTNDLEDGLKGVGINEYDDAMKGTSPQRKRLQ